ncbi:hypothetical protein MMPV_008529 [Pyropia vietnamensis]
MLARGCPRRRPCRPLPPPAATSATSRGVVGTALRLGWLPAGALSVAAGAASVLLALFAFWSVRRVVAAGIFGGAGGWGRPTDADERDAAAAADAAAVADDGRPWWTTWRREVAAGAGPGAAASVMAAATAAASAKPTGRRRGTRTPPRRSSGGRPAGRSPWAWIRSVGEPAPASSRNPVATAAPFWTAAGAAAEAAAASTAAAAAASEATAAGTPPLSPAASAAAIGEPPAGTGGSSGDWAAQLDALADGASAELAAKLHPRRDKTLWWASAAEGADLAAAAARKADAEAAEAAARSPAYAAGGDSPDGVPAADAGGRRRRGADLRAAFRAARARAAGGGVRVDSQSLRGSPGWATAAGVGEDASSAAAVMATLSPTRAGATTTSRTGRGSLFDQSPPEPEESASLFDSEYEEGWGLFPRTSPAARRSGYTPVSMTDDAAYGGVRRSGGALDDGSPPWRFFPMREGESEEDRQARLRSFLTAPGGLTARLAATALVVVVARELLEPAHPGAGAQLVGAARLVVGGGVGALGHWALSAAALPVHAATAAARFTVDLL